MPTGDDLARDTVAVVLAGGKGARLGPLTRNDCKPALPFGAAYHNIDFSLANCVNSHIHRIGVATQYKPESLLRHVTNVWSGFARRAGEFIDVWPAKTRAPETGYLGTADAIFKNLDFLESQHCGLVLVLAGDHVYQMDYRPMLEFHRRRHADVTIGCIVVPADAASQFGILSTDATGRVEQFVEKPNSPDDLPVGGHMLASMGIYVFDLPFLARILRKDAFSKQSQHDFGRDILPSVLGWSNVYAYQYVGPEDSETAYWCDVGTPAAYWRAHLELLDDAPSIHLDDVNWPMPALSGQPELTRRHARPGSKQRNRSLIAEGCEVKGVVNRSVLFPGVRVSSGSVVQNSVVLPGASIGRNCRLSDAIVDSECHIPDGTVIGPSRRRAAGESTGEPIIVTTADFESDSMSASA
jgi:glucose-1-phosphate adenylyltransferase